MVGYLLINQTLRSYVADSAQYEPFESVVRSRLASLTIGTPIHAEEAVSSVLECAAVAVAIARGAADQAERAGESKSPEQLASGRPLTNTHAQTTWAL